MKSLAIAEVICLRRQKRYAVRWKAFCRIRICPSMSLPRLYFPCKYRFVLAFIFSLNMPCFQTNKVYLHWKLFALENHLFPNPPWCFRKIKFANSFISHLNTWFPFAAAEKCFSVQNKNMKKVTEYNVCVWGGLHSMLFLYWVQDGTCFCPPCHIISIITTLWGRSG